jgi:small subunit ribosomal protein S6e
MRNRNPGVRIRKLIRGNMVTEEIYQLNCKLLEGKLPEQSATEQSATEQSVEEPKS